MKKIFLIAILGSVCTTQGHAIYASGMSSMGLDSESRASSGKDPIGWDAKIILEANDDAQIFVATDGQVIGTRLQEAFEQIRRTYPSSVNSSDLDLALTILNYQAQ
jgi:uncharacterized protein (TIGR02448 family)